MTVDEMLSVQKWVKQGAKLQVGRDYTGRQKIKISHGPLNIFTHRFSVTENEMATLKSLIEKESHKAA